MSRLVDVVAWVMLVLGALLFVISLIQILLFLVAGGSERALYFSTGFLAGLLVWIGAGLRRRRNSARIGAIVVLGLLILYNAYWIVAALMRLPWPAMPPELRIPLVGVFAFWTAMYAFLLVRFQGKAIALEFRKDDV